MNISIDIDPKIPEFARHWLGCEATALIEQFKRAVLVADLCPGDALPSVLQLSNDLGLASDVVTKAYAVLEHESVIETRPWGTFVHRRAPQNCGGL